VGNLNAISDGATGATLARAAITAAGYNVRINVASLQDQQQAAALRQELRLLEQQADQLQAQVQAQLSERGGMDLP
jgi:formiminotetrahydrofolate cyclodeaminase